MKKFNQIKNHIKYEKVFERALNIFRYNTLRSGLLFKYKNITECITEFFVLDSKNKIWILYDILPKTYNFLNKNNIQYFTYKKLIYGFYKNIEKNNTLIICNENERFS